MRSSPKQKRGPALATKVSFSAEAMQVLLADGRELRVPLTWFPRLLKATDQERGA